MAGSARERRRAMYPNAFHSVPRYIPQDRPDDNGPGRTTADACLSQVVVYVDISGRSWTPLVLDVAEGEGFEPSIRLPVYTLSRRAPSATRPPLRRRLRRGRLRCEAPKAGSAGTRLDVARCLRRKGSGPS